MVDDESSIYDINLVYFNEISIRNSGSDDNSLHVKKLSFTLKNDNITWDILKFDVIE